MTFLTRWNYHLVFILSRMTIGCLNNNKDVLFIRDIDWFIEEKASKMSYKENNVYCWTRLVLASDNPSQQTCPSCPCQVFSNIGMKPNCLRHNQSCSNFWVHPFHGFPKADSSGIKAITGQQYMSWLSAARFRPGGKVTFGNRPWRTLFVWLHVENSQQWGPCECKHHLFNFYRYFCVLILPL